MMDRRAATRPAKSGNSLAKQQYFLSPNPNNGVFTLSQLIPENDAVNAEIINETGETVFKGPLHFETGITQMVMPNKVPGLYLLRLLDKYGNEKNIKFVIE